MVSLAKLSFDFIPGKLYELIEMLLVLFKIAAYRYILYTIFKCKQVVFSSAENGSSSSSPK